VLPAAGDMEVCSRDLRGDIPARLERREPVALAVDHERPDTKLWQ
jgi:hypothetical protein